jgi:hypothetical protein
MRVELVYECGCDWTSNNRQGYQAVMILRIGVGFVL